MSLKRKVSLGGGTAMSNEYEKAPLDSSGIRSMKLSRTPLVLEIEMFVLIFPRISLSLRISPLEMHGIADRKLRCANRNIVIEALLTLVVSVRADLQANGQIDDVQVGGRAGEARVLPGPGAGHARLVAGPADAALVREAPRRAAADASAEKRRIRKWTFLG